MATCADKINPELHKSETVHTKQVQKEIITPKCLHHSSLAADNRLTGDEALIKNIAKGTTDPGVDCFDQ